MDLGKSRPAAIGDVRRPLGRPAPGERASHKTHSVGVRAVFGGLLVGLLGCNSAESTVEPLSGLTYSANPAVYTKGTAITPNVPTSVGGLAASYTVSPALPSGLGLHASSGVISGTPDTVSPATDYVVTASNPKGSAAVVLNITVHDLATVAPSGLSYATNPAVYTKGVAIAPNMPTSAGGAVVSYAVSPSLPAGLTLNSSTGVISGTPSTIVATANYTVTATNLGGTSMVALSLTVNDAPPANLTYLSNPAVYAKGKVITSNTPSSTGGTVVSYSVAPSLPAGLSLDPSAGAIYGTPTTVTATAIYTVTASNTGGSTTVLLSLTVTDAPPSSIKYARNPAVYVKGETIPPNLPTTTGGAVTSYSVSPALPAGVSLDTSTGAVYGTPTAQVVATTYTVTATNSGGFSSVGLSIAVLDSLPTLGLVAYYPLNGDTKDLSGNANDGVIYGTVVPAEDRLGVAAQAMHFDGASYVKASATGLPTTTRTVSLWFKTTIVTDWAVPLGYGGNSCGVSLFLVISTAWMMAGVHCNYTPYFYYYYATPPGPGWHHWALTIASDVMWMYLDGVQVATTTSVFPATYVAGRDLSLGVAVGPQGYAPYTGSNTYFRGDMDEVRIYDRALTETEVIALACH